jgi:hypothetical protein
MKLTLKLKSWSSLVATVGVLLLPVGCGASAPAVDKEVGAEVPTAVTPVAAEPTATVMMVQPTLAPAPTATPTPPPTATPTAAPTPTATSMPTSTPDPTPTTERTVEVGMSRRNPADVDDALTIAFDATFEDPHTAEVTLLEVIRGNQAWRRIQQANQFNEPAPEGQEYILARIRFKLTDAPSPDMQYALWSGAFTAVSQDGRDYPLSLVVVPEPPIDANLYPGASHEGWAVFQVSDDDEQPLLAFGRAFDGTGGAWWKLYK